MAPPAKDMAGKTFGWLTVLYRVKSEVSGGNAYWRCRCVCGTEKSINGSSLRNGNTTSCGCKAKLGAKSRHRMTKRKPVTVYGDCSFGSIEDLEDISW